MTGQALRMRVEIAELMRKHRASPKPFTAPALLPFVDHDLIVEGYAAPAVVDREFTKFAAHCWLPFKSDIPLLYRHDRPVGKILELRCDDRGLRVRARVSDREAATCSHFSVAAVIHAFELRDVDDPERFHALVTAASLTEVSLVGHPANPAAKIEHRYRPSAQVDQYDIWLRWADTMQKFVSALRTINAAGPCPTTPSPKSPVPKLRRVAPPLVHRPKTEFAKFVEELNHAHQRQDGA